MKDLLPGYYRPDDATLRDMMRSAKVVLDSSALLNLYRYPSQAREDLLSVLDTISDRLWIPHQVAIEFQQNRLAVIADQVARFREVRRVIDQTERNFVVELSQLQLDKRHSTINPKRFVDRIHRAFKDFNENLEALERKQPDVYHEDAIRLRVDELLIGRIGPILPQEELQEIVSAGKKRYEHRVPPGYMDESKTDDCYMYGGTFVGRKFGDLILWHELMKNASKNETKHVIFVTDDEKEDWWWLVSSGGSKTLGPRPELIHEIMHKAGVHAFWMYNSERFLRFAGEHLDIKLTKGSVETVRDVARVHSSEHMPTMALLAEQAVKAWLVDRFDTVAETTSYPDFICFDRDTGSRHGYDVKYRERTVSSYIVRHLLRVATRRAETRKLDEYTVVIVFPTTPMAEIAAHDFRRN